MIIEITERAHLDTVPDAESRIGRLRAMGFRIAIDDIGAGYSGLNSFTMLRPDLVKLDMALVRGIDTDPVKRRLAGLLVQLCQDLGIAVVGECVETVAEREVLTGSRLRPAAGLVCSAGLRAPFLAPSFTGT